MVALNYTLNNTIYYTMDKCSIDTSAMLNSVTSIPKNGYYVLLFGLGCLIFYFMIQPKLSEKFKENFDNKIGLLGTCLVFLASWVLFLGVFHLEGEQLKSISRIAGWLIAPLLLFLGYIIYKKVKGVKFD